MLWRWGYVIFAVFAAILVAGVLFTARQWRAPELPTGTSAPKAGLSDTLRLPIMLLLIALITLVVGLEFSPGQWTFSLFTESRSMTVDLAGLMVTLYWGGFMVGRFLFGALGNNLKPVAALRGCMVAAAVGAVLVWLDAGPAVNFIGVILLGLAQAPIFPLLVTAIPERVGTHHAANAIGFLISAAGVGIAILPGLVGRLAKNLGLEVVGPLLVVMAVGMFVLHEMLVRYRKPQP
jgi:fucose permease